MITSSLQKLNFAISYLLQVKFVSVNYMMNLILPKTELCHILLASN